MTAVVDALAAYRLVRLAQRDQLPPLPAVRARLHEAAAGRSWAELLDCAWCAGVHVSALVLLARHRAPKTWAPLATVLASSAVVGLLTTAEDALHSAAGDDGWDVTWPDDQLPGAMNGSAYQVGG